MSVVHRSLRRPLRRPMRVGGTVVLGLSTIALTGAFATGQATAATSAVTPSYTAINNSMIPTTNAITGAYSAAKMTVDVSLAPRDEAGLNSELQATYTAKTSQYHKFLAKGQFDAKYAPASATVSAVENYLRSQGLSVSATDSPFLLAATGSSTRVEAAFRTSLNNFVGAKDTHYFANSKPVYVPSSIASAVQGVVGLTNTVRLTSQAVRPADGKAVKSAATPATASCEAGYPTTQDLFNLEVAGKAVALGYGGGPGCSGLTPAQTNSTYTAPAASARTKGTGVDTAVFELSEFQLSNIETWAHTFYGSKFTPDITQVAPVDGGPLKPVCPTGDSCPISAASNAFSGDIEVDADIEQELAVAPDAHIFVYNAPNDETGQTELAEYADIANQDVASTVSSSWGECEADEGEAAAQAENTVFEQMALQGQSMFASAGDSGAFDCIVETTPTQLSVDDPSSQPWVTSAGGTSLGTDNPGTKAAPGKPNAGVQTVWNPDNLCSSAAKSAANDNQGGFFWCGGAGAGGGGGGSSMFWAAPFYQHGPGVTSKFTTHGSASCAMATTASTPCRQVPDVSANADEFTGYSEFCTGNAKTTPDSVCATIGDGGGFFAIGGTSLSAPLWGALIADRDSFQGGRTGNINPLVYSWLSSGQQSKFFTDIATPAKSSEKGVVPATNNGHFPTLPGYDEATGIGAPHFAAIIEES
jgi:subtilase family serine protease